MILDEATSSLDSSSENFVQNAIEDIRSKNKTVVLIAHRLSTVVEADKIVVLSKGKVLEEGSHTDLYESKGHYYKLWQQQMPKVLTVA